jgi:hypothetical protein
MAKVGSRRKGILIAAVIAAGYFILRGINFVNSLEIIPKKQIRFGGSLSYPEAFLTFTLINPTDETVTVDRLIGNVFYNSKNVASVSANESIQLGAKQAMEIEVRLVSQLTDLIAMLKNIFTGSANNNLVFNGSVTANGIPIPINKTLV